MVDDSSWRAIREGEARRELRAFELVLTARGIDSRIDWRDGVWLLLVAAEEAPVAERELGAYERENPPVVPPPPPPRVDSGWWGVAGYCACVWLTMALNEAGAFGWDWRTAGRLHVGSVAVGEWWRLTTALTLHADLGHIMANTVFGAFFGLLAGRYLGSGLAWLCILLGGIAGNALNAIARPEQFASLGASTATFAAVGLVGAFMWRTGYFAGGLASFSTPGDAGAGRIARTGGTLAGLRALAPVFAVVALFAFTGIGDDNTDVIAHLAGMVAGFAIGLAVARARLQLSGRKAQRCYGFAALAVVLVAWLAAI